MSRVKFTFKRLVAAIVLLAFVVVGAAACTSSSGNPPAQKKESATQQDSYNKLVAEAPAHEVTNPVNRNTINFYVDTWNKPGAKAYVYLQNSEGNLLGYYVLDGPPVSMCTALTPTYKLTDPGGSSDNGDIVVPAPGIDGVYYSGGECNTYYGKDATTGAYVQFTLGLGINELLYNQPLPNHPNVTNLSTGTK